MTSVKLSKLTAVILAALLMLALFITPAFATSEETTTAAETTAAAAETTAAAEDEEGDDVSTDTKEPTETKKSFNWDLWLSVGIITVAVLVFFGFYIFSEKWREKVKQFIRDYKSELKKVVWSPWSDVKKNTIVVLVISLGTAILIGVLDVIFSKGIHALDSLIK